MRREVEKWIFYLVIFVLLAAEAYRERKPSKPPKYGKWKPFKNPKHGEWKPFNPPKHEGDTCTTFYGQNWTCQRTNKCTVLTPLKLKGWAHSCSDQGKKRTICCPQLKDLRNVAHPVSRAISDRKCQEYESKLCTKKVQLKTTYYVLNGEPVKPEEVPYVVRVGYKGLDGKPPSWHCGGVLISEQFVLSAAHCAYQTNLDKARWVRLQGLKGQTIQIEEILYHPSYKKSTFYNDIALFRLKTSIEFNKSVAPACIHALPFDVAGTVTAVGWGRIGRDRGFSSDPLQVELDIIETNECKRNEMIVKGTKHLIPKGIDGNTMICAWAKDKDVCDGDSGGPLVWTRSPHCLSHLVGITSFGPGGCKRSEAPGIYTRVSAFVPWIESIVWPKQKH